MVIKGVVFNVLAVATHLLQGTPQEARHRAISPGSFLSQEKIENSDTSANYSYKILDSQKHPYFLKVMSPHGLEDGDFMDVDEDEAAADAAVCAPQHSVNVLKLPPLPQLAGLDTGGQSSPIVKRKKPGLKLNFGSTESLSMKPKNSAPKSLPIETIVENEVDSSRLAAYITDGLVPWAEPYEDHHKIVQDYIELDKEKTKKYFHGGVINFQEWSDHAKEQFFTHMLADLLLKNTDAHYQQFGVATNGDIVGFDKGKANLSDRYSKSWDEKFGIRQLTFESKVVYGGYVEYLATHRDELNKILNSKTVSHAFGRVAEVASKLEKNLERPDFNSPSGENPARYKKFYHSYVNRFKNIQQDVHSYFESIPAL